MDAEDGDGDGDGELEVISRGGKGDGGGAWVIGAEAFCHEEGDEEHYAEVDEEGDGNAKDVEGEIDDFLSFVGEHEDDGGEEGDEGQWGDFGEKTCFVPCFAFGFDEENAREKSREKGDAEVDGDAGENFAKGNVNGDGLEADEGRENGQKEPRVSGVEEDLGEAIEGDEACGVLGAAFGEVVPDENHGDAAGDTDEDEAGHVAGLIAEEDDRENPHEDGADEPILHEGEAEDAGVAEDFGELLIADFGERWVHHDDEPDGERDVGGAEGDRAEKFLGIGEEKFSEDDADCHGEENPEREKSVEEGEFGGSFLHKTREF